MINISIKLTGATAEDVAVVKRVTDLLQCHPYNKESNVASVTTRFHEFDPCGYPVSISIDVETTTDIPF